MQTLFDIRKRTEYASCEKHVDNAPNAPGASKLTRHSASDGKKTNPDTLTDDKKTNPTPRKQIYIGRDMRQCEPNTHISSMRDGQRKLRIDRPSKLFHKKRETSPKKYLDEA